MSSLIFPDDIIVEILSWLPVKPIFRFRCVCKTWCKLLGSNNSDFVEKHLNHNIENNNLSLMLNNVFSDLLCTIDYCDLSSSSSLLLFDNVADVRKFDLCPMKDACGIRIWGSCNGLLCVTNGSDDKIISIWNPATNEYKVIPSHPPVKNPQDEFHVYYGFGYDCNIKDYKLVRIVSFHLADSSEVSIITLRSSSSWERIEDIPYNLYYGDVRGVLVNGALHWIATRRIESEISEVILSFDIADERFQEMQVPICSEYNLQTFVDVFEGSICLLVVDYTLAQIRIDVWVMKDYGVIESWTKHFSVTEELDMCSVWPIQSFKNGEIILRNEVSYNTWDLVSYDPKHERAGTLKKICGIPSGFKVITYVGSLVSLNSGTYVDSRAK